MATVSKPFVNASISPLKRALSWCPISPTKIALVYVATTGGSPRYFVQIVNFVSGVPVYGPPCMILLQAVANTAPCMRMVKVAADRLLFSVPKVLGASQVQQAKSSLVLVKVNGDDTVEFIAESADIQISNATAGSSSHIFGMLGGNNSAVLYGTTTGTSNVSTQAMWAVSTANDVIAVTAPVPNTGQGTNAPVPYESILRTGLDGKPWIMQNPAANVLFTACRDAVYSDRNNMCCTALSTVTAFVNGYLPVRDDTLLFLNAATIQVRTLTRGANQLGNVDSTLVATLNWRNASEYVAGKVEDSIWLDTDGSFVSAYTTGAPMTANDTGTSAETLGSVAPLKLYIARYIEATQSIQQAADFPLDLNVNIPRRNWDRMLHKVDSKTIAVIGAFCPIGQFNVQHGIIMVTAP